MQKTTATKAWFAAGTTLVLALAARFTGIVEMPATDTLTDAMMTLGMAGIAAGVNFAITWLSPANKPS